MALVLTSGPAVEPVTLTEAKAYLRVDLSDEDTLIASLITAARIHVEVSLGRSLITQSWSLFLDQWPEARVLTLPIAPLQSVTDVRTYAEDDTAIIWDASNYFVDASSDPGRVVRQNTASWPPPGRPANGVEVAFVAGYGNGASDVPEPIRQALLLLIAHWYERREPVALGGRPISVPGTVSGLLDPYRRIHL